MVLFLRKSELTYSAMDVGVTAAFDFTGSAPFVVEYTEKREGGRVSTKSKEFKGYHGDIVLQPDREGQYTYVSTPEGSQS
jgi:nucleoporin POM152